MAGPNQGGNPTNIYQHRTAQQTITVEEHAQQQQHAAPITQQAGHQHREQTPYERFFTGLSPLPPVPVAAGNAPQEQRLGRKERRRQQRETDRHHAEYKKLSGDLSAEPRLLDEREVKEMPLFRTKQGRDKWANEKLPHSSLTREQTMKQILNDKDYSNFENLDAVMRNMVASRALAEFVDRYDVNKYSNPQALCRRLQRSGAGVSALLDPALRLGLSLAQRTDRISPEMKWIFQELDEAMSTAVMVSTLTHVADETKVKTYFQNKGASHPDQDASNAITANKAQQIQIAKRLLLMQLSNFLQVNKDANGRPSQGPWLKSMAVALSHCSRVALTLPRQDSQNSNAQWQRKMWNSILRTGGENPARDNWRFSSTHSIIRRSVNSDAVVGSKEKKRWFNLIGQRGMNCAIGGLGNEGISGKTICNDGTCGHFYSMHKEASSSNYGAMLMGLESDSFRKTNQMGHTHDIRATAEKASSLGGQRTDEVGEKYGGRQCDLTGMSAKNISIWMDALEQAMTRWQSQDEGMSSPEAMQAMELLAGKKLNANNWFTLRRLLRLDEPVQIGPVAD